MLWRCLDNRAPFYYGAHWREGNPLGAQSQVTDGVTVAPEGQIYVCGACGKTSMTRYGFDSDEKRVADRGWDTSCATWATLCFKDSIERSPEGRIVSARAVPETPEVAT